MNKRGKTIAVVVGLGILGISGAAFAFGGGDKKKTTDACPDGMRVNTKRLAAIASAKTPAQRNAANAMPLCVPIDCPVGFERDAADNCVSIDDPGVKFCPVGQHFDPDRGECVADDDPTVCPPDQVYDLELESCRQKCPEGMHWVGEWNGIPGRCVNDTPTVEPVTPKDKTCPEGQHWVDDWNGILGRCVNDTPTADIDDYIKVYPQGNNFYQMKKGDIVGWGLEGLHVNAVSQNLLGRELFLAARNVGGLDDAAALEWANDRRRNQELTNKIYNAFMCCAWFDMVYCTWGYCGPTADANEVCQGVNRPGLHGRACRPLTQHADNIERMKQGLAPARTVSMLTAAQKGNGKSKAVASANPGGKNSYPVFWCMGIDRKHLWERDGTDVLFLSDQALPPDFIWNRGYENLSGPSASLPSYGCTGGGYDGRASV